MAKNATVAELKAKLEESEKKRNDLGQQTLAMACFIREQFVKTLSYEVLDTSIYKANVIAFLNYVESVKPSVGCEKCLESGVVDIRGSLVRCFSCGIGRMLTGKGGKRHYIDILVEKAYQQSRQERRDNRFQNQRPQLSNEEIEAYKKALASKGTAAARGDVEMPF